jgi:hypothetical protein
MASYLGDRILDLEWAMFVAVKSDRPAACQTTPASFRNIRASLLDAWTSRMLAAYCADLERAAGQGRNLLAEKYARMGELIPPLADDPVIDLIVAVECRWQEEIRRRFPLLYQRCCRSTAETGDGREFAVYLRAELETYGFETRQLYFLNIKNAERAGRNLGIEALQALIHRFGYEGLDQAERQFRGNDALPAEVSPCA